MMRNLLVLGLFTSLIGAPAEGAVLFSNDFNSENGGAGALNYTGFSNFTVSGGTVDLIGNGLFDLLPGNGLYVDLDGSTNDAGLLTANGTAVVPGLHTLFFSLAGSHGGTLEDVTVSIFGSSPYLTTTFSIPSASPFAELGLSFTVAGPDVVQFSFQNGGAPGDNVGALLDNVRLEGPRETTVVPEPASMVLLGTGLAGLVRRVRRHRSSSH